MGKIARGGGIHYGFHGYHTNYGLPVNVPLTAFGRFMQVEKGRTLLYVSRKLVGDSAWPFEAGEKVELKLDPKKKQLVITKV